MYVNLSKVAVSTPSNMRNTIMKKEEYADKIWTMRRQTDQCAAYMRLGKTENGLQTESLFRCTQGVPYAKLIWANNMDNRLCRLSMNDFSYPHT